MSCKYWSDKIDYADSHKMLIASIFTCAVNDACSGTNTKDARRNKKSALIFLEKDNSLFNCYCHLLSIDPEYFHDSIWHYINSKLLRKNKIQKGKLLNDHSA